MENNQRIREDVLRSVSHLSDQQLNEKVEEGKWSIMQILEHLYLMEKSVVRRISEALSGENQPAEEKPIEFVLNRTKKVEAPDFLLPTREFITLEEMKRLLAESRGELIQFVSSLSEEDLNEKSYSHRLFGRLSLKQWVQLIGLHEQRHMEQIEEVKEQLLVP